MEENKIIESLTEEQTQQLEVYKQKWLKIGSSTERANRKEAEKWVIEAYKQAGITPPTEILWFESPMAALKASLKFFELPESKENYENVIQNFCFGNQEAYWLSFYDYCLEVLNLDCCKPLVPLINLSQVCGWWMPFETVAFMAERPLEIHLKNEVLHCENGPAIKYADGYSVYALNGVRLSKEIVETPWNKIPVNLVVTEKNAEIRREIVRKIGIERIVNEMGATVLDKKGDYELLDLKIDERTRPYLKMTNPSIGVFHIEGVPPGTKTVEEALIFRNGTHEAPQILT